jgi:phage baseplate assembly protein W
MANYDAGSVSNKSKRSARIFKDLNLDFQQNSATKDIQRVEDVEAVKRSVRNLISLNHYEKPFHPEIGSDVRALLFELMTPLTALNLERKVAEVLLNFEPRASIESIIAAPDIDANRYHLQISFYVVGIQSPIIVETFLQRLR